jgi:hypothetical protein
LRDFTETRKSENEFAQLFAGHPLLDVHYEVLERDYQAEMERVQQFLGITVERLAVKTSRQSDKPLSVSIANYHELKEQFRGTEWEEFFDE